MVRTFAVLMFAGACVAAQDDPFHKKAPYPGESRLRSNEMRDGKRRVTGAELERNKADLLVTAKSLVYPITDPVLYAAPEADPKKPTELRPIPNNETVQYRIDEFDKSILKPALGSKLNFDQFDYIVHYGQVLDQVFRELLAPEMPAHIRVNAMRMLALAARSGAPAHAPMIIEMIANADTPPEILNYALQAAGNLLAAYDPRQDGLNLHIHTIKDPELVKLINTLEGVLNRRTPYGLQGELRQAQQKEPAGEAAEPAAPQISDEQAMVMRFVRRQAVRALSEVRYPSFTEAKSGETVRPLYLLCRVAANDGPFMPDLGSEEYAAAVLGLLNLKSLRGVDLDTLQTCIALGTQNFGTRKARNAADTSIPWRFNAARMNARLAEFTQVAGAKANPLAELLAARVFTPLEQNIKASTVPSAFELTAVQAWLQNRKTDALVPYLDLPAEQIDKLTIKPVPLKN